MLAQLPTSTVPYTNGVVDPPALQRRDNAMLVRQIDDERECWSLSRTEPMTIGRDESCHVNVPLRKVSRQHARVLWFQGQYVIEDMGSTNGTAVNGELCRGPVALQDGDEIQIGSCTKLMFLDEETTEPVECLQSQPGLQIDQKSRSLTINGVRLNQPLSPPQFGLLKVLVEAAGEIVSRDEIVNAIWPDDSYDGVSEQAIDAIVRRIRIRIREVDGEHPYIETVRGHGFRFVQRHPTLRQRKHPVRVG